MFEIIYILSELMLSGLNNIMLGVTLRNNSEAKLARDIIIDFSNGESITLGKDKRVNVKEASSDSRA